ncbi:TIM44 subunit of mitochondria import inner membrane translocase [Calocera cornea HHB12733]|uniref:Mitochondrial import inner membrane translocase subunit TIM44 n=1 Tax=Calocera cornea HHB12733 TaxID=1353952 RepID=A0A165HAH3_9BASI|nr:TIM44 subunit of mitochondria import inner membrane translocase [Calocera cornea HHB12733]
MLRAIASSSTSPVYRAAAQRPTARAAAIARSRRLPAAAAAPRALHTSQPRRDELPKSPFQTFVDVLRDEIRKNRELQENVKQLQGDIGKVQDSEAMKRAKEMYERARLTSSIKENPRLRAAAEEMKKAGIKVGDAVSEAMKGLEESEFMKGIARASAAVSSAVSSTTEPIRNTAAYKAMAEAVVEALDDSGSTRHAGYEEKEVRRMRRQKRLAKAGQEGRLAARQAALQAGRSASSMASQQARTAADPEAGSALVLHKDAAKHEAWERLKSTNPVLRTFSQLKQQYDESENPVVATIRGITSSIGSFFDETEMAKVVRLLRQMDPTFSVEPFTRELREYIIPEVVDAYLSADKEALQMWCGEATYHVLWATMEQYLRQGLVSDSKVLDIRQVDLTTGRILENDVPVFVVTFATQEILLFRNAKSGEVVVGAADKVEQCSYAAVLTRVEEELENPVTGGWKVVEMARRSARGFL